MGYGCWMEMCWLHNYLGVIVVRSTEFVSSCIDLLMTTAL